MLLILRHGYLLTSERYTDLNDIVDTKAAHFLIVFLLSDL